jgi:hypothetical protein
MASSLILIVIAYLAAVIAAIVLAVSARGRAEELANRLARIEVNSHQLVPPACYQHHRRTHYRAATEDQTPTSQHLGITEPVAAPTSASVPSVTPASSAAVTKSFEENFGTAGRCGSAVSPLFLVATFLFAIRLNKVCSDRASKFSWAQYWRPHSSRRASGRGARKKSLVLRPYFPQVEEAIWSEFSGPFHDMKACSGTASSRSTWRCKCVNSRSNVCRILPSWTSLLRAARLNSRKICSVVGCAQGRCSG